MVCVGRIHVYLTPLTLSVSPLEVQFVQRGLVRHKRPYWAITDDEGRLHSAYQLHQHYQTADEQYGEETLEALQTDEMEDVQ